MRGFPVQVEVADPGAAMTSTSSRYSERMIENLPSYPCAKLKLDQFFLQWLSENQEVVNALVDDIQAGRPVRGPSNLQLGASPLSPLSANAIFSSTPPLSPSKARSPGTPLSPHRRSITSSNLKKASLGPIPQFYFPSRGGASEPARSEFLKRAEQRAAGRPGFSQREFVEFLQETSDLPSMVGYTLFRRLAGSDDGTLAPAVLAKFWADRGLENAAPAKRVYEALRTEGHQALLFDDLCLLLEQVLRQHPGLAFLQETAEFQRKYAETVIYRIFYNLSKTGAGRLTLRELRRGDFLDALHALDREDDINKVLKYFSYEHFYVIYCKFWELDTDHDFLIDRDDLAHYAQCALSFNIIDRIFELQSSRPVPNAVPGKMNYEEFVWFILSEEDKTTDTALEYWFKCVDLDGDGVIRSAELWHFYQEQQRRLETTHHEVVQFEDLVCQLHDMLTPSIEGRYTLSDLKRMKPQSGLLFNALFNLPKFVGFENRDPFQVRAEAAEFAGLSEWDKFAKVEYFRLASEDDQDEGVIEPEDASIWAADTPMADNR